jgi:hypothetical protein
MEPKTADGLVHPRSSVFRSDRTSPGSWQGGLAHRAQAATLLCASRHPRPHRAQAATLGGAAHREQTATLCQEAPFAEIDLTIVREPPPWEKKPHQPGL